MTLSCLLLLCLLAVYVSALRREEEGEGRGECGREGGRQKSWGGGGGGSPVYTEAGWGGEVVSACCLLPSICSITFCLPLPITSFSYISAFPLYTLGWGKEEV